MRSFSLDRLHLVEVGTESAEETRDEKLDPWAPVGPDAQISSVGAPQELSLTQGFNEVLYRWWCRPPKGYEPVVAFCNALFELGGTGVKIDPSRRGAEPVPNGW